MRDNHTFRELPADADEALKIIAEEARDGFTNGSLFATNPDETNGVHLHGSDDWLRFDKAAREWFASQQPRQSDGGTDV